MAKKIGVIGSGSVGQTLTNGFVKHGYEVVIGSNNPASRETLKAKIKGPARIGSFEEAAKFGEIVVLAVKGLAAEPTVKALGAAALKGKTVIDVTNPIADAPPVHGVISFFTKADESLMERLQRAVPEARFVKAFNSVGNGLMVNPELPGGKPSMFICGNDKDAKDDVKTILAQFGFETEDMGDIEAARVIEPLCILWCIPGFLRNDWMHAFKILRKA